MKVTPYDKLVRDNIPDIIASQGKTCACTRLSDSEYIKRLADKLLEEASEYAQSGDVEELADIGEVMHAILAFKGVSIEEFQRVRMEKRAARGGFDKRLLLVSVTENEGDEA